MEKSFSLSLAMIVKDEEETLERCLKSVKELVDEIIIVDTGSTDKTKEIAKKFNSKIYDFQWIDNFSAARNFSFSKTTSEYILWLDGDDYIKEEELILAKSFFENFNKQWDYVSLDYILGRSQGKVNFSLKRNRIVKKSMNFKWIGAVHEYLEVYGNGAFGNFSIEHGKVKGYSDRNLKIFKAMETRGADFSSRDLFYYGNELKDNLLYEEAIEKYKEFLDSKKGWIEDIKSAYVKLVDCLNRIGRNEEAVNFAYESFKVDLPKPEVCCSLGAYYFEQKDYRRAIYWYNIALESPPEQGNLAMAIKDYYTIIPALQLSVCYYKVGNLKASYIANELAFSFFSKAEVVLSNRTYFANEFKILGIELPEIQEPIDIYNWKKYIK